MNTPPIHERNTPDDRPEPVRQVATQPRRAYTTPHLRLLGNLAELTQGGGGTDTDANFGSLDG